jgi:hypothetical protein
VILYAARRYLSMTPGQWDALSWDMRETYLDGLSQDPEVPFRREEEPPWAAGAAAAPGVPGPQERKADTGAQVFDIRGMITALENDPGARKRS